MKPHFFRGGARASTRIVSAALTIAIAAVGAPSAHAVTFTAVSHTEHSGARTPDFGDTEVQAVVAGARGRLEYLRGGFGVPKDRVLVTEDGGRSVTFYDPESQTCGDAPAAALPGTGSGARAAALHRYDNVRVEKKLDAPGAKLHGVATRHQRYAISYDMDGGEQSPSGLHVAIDSELWVAPSLQDPAFALWLRAAPRTGDAAVDGHIDDGMKNARGAALKRIERTTLQRKGSPAQTLTTSMEVTQFVAGKPAAGALDPPFTCRSRTPKQ